MGNCCKIFKKRSKPEQKYAQLSSAEDKQKIQIVDADGFITFYTPQIELAQNLDFQEIIQCRAETLDKKYANITVQLSDRVDSVRQRIKEKIGVDQFILIFDGQVLEDTENILKYKICQGAVIDVIPNE